jgi:hypothetical protein
MLTIGIRPKFLEKNVFERCPTRLDSKRLEYVSFMVAELLLILTVAVTSILARLAWGSRSKNKAGFFLQGTPACGGDADSPSIIPSRAEC